MKPADIQAQIESLLNLIKILARDAALRLRASARAP